MPNAAPTHDPDVWLFDLDNTLYPARCNLFAQIDVRIGRYISDWLKVDAGRGAASCRSSTGATTAPRCAA